MRKLGRDGEAFGCLEGKKRKKGRLEKQTRERDWNVPESFWNGKAASGMGKLTLEWES